MVRATPSHQRYEAPLTSGNPAPQVECPAVTPEAVLRASGHVDRFTDFMVTDTLTGDCHRADHLLKAALEALLDDAKSGLTPEKRRVRRFPTSCRLFQGVQGVLEGVRFALLTCTLQQMRGHQLLAF